jgi:D-alanyl-D-alanine carboxypeptidase
LALPPAFPPGAGFLYSNTNTVLLGLIIEQLTDRSLTDALAERIFEPLGLAHTYFPPPADAGMPEPHPHGYLFGTNVSTLIDPALSPEDRAAAVTGRLLPNDVSDLNPSWGWAAGAATSTAEDLATYVEALVGGGLLEPRLQRERLDSVRPIDPAAPASTGYGLALARFGPLLGHDGSLPGFQSFMGHDPQRGLTVIVLTNLQNTPDGDGAANALTKLIIAQLYPTPGSPTSPSPPGTEA